MRDNENTGNEGNSAMTGGKEESNVDVLIEIPLGSNHKYEKCKKTGLLRCDRILYSPYVYPFNYGYFPNTLAGDGDELDAVVVTKYPLIPNSLIECKIIGVLKTRDEKGFDDKIICVPVSRVDPEFKDVYNYKDLKQSEVDMIEYFFRTYKNREYKKFVEIIGFADASSAKHLYKQSQIDFCKERELPAKPKNI